MRTHNMDRSSRTHRMFRSMCRLVVLACLLAVMPAAAAPPASPALDNPVAAGVPSLAEFLNPDGSLALPVGRALSLDSRGYRLVSGPGEAPRFAPAQPDANPGDENWASGLFSLPGTDGSVYAVAVDGNGHAYVGGTFPTAGGVTANNIAKWNGATWSAPGSGMNGIVRALAVDAAGNLYAGGAFTTAGGVSANHIAKWDGATWSALDSGMNGEVRALAVDAAGHLYAGGSFTTAGGISVNNIATWDGTAWFPLGSGITGGEPYLGVSALAVDADGNLYAGGFFTTAGGVSAHNIAKWDGATWSALGSGMSGGDFPYVSALAFDVAGNLYAGGSFITAGGVNAHNIAKWDGATWSALDSGMNSAVSALVFDAAGNLYAGGWFTTAGGVSANRIAKWDGVAWSALGSGMNGEVRALAVDAAGNLYAGGIFTSAGGVSANYIAKWDGSTWSALGSGLSDLSNPPVGALAIDAAGNLYAGGTLTTAGGIGANHIAKWDGATWSPLGSGVNSLVRTLALDGSGNLYAGGESTTAGNHASAYIGRWTTADGVRGVTAGSYTFYVNNLPVKIDVVTPGTLYRLAVQRVNRSHPQAPPELATGYYWQVTARDANNHPATGYAVDLTLPTTFTADDYDQVCRFTGAAWNCAANAHASDSITRTRITNLSDWTAGNYPPPDPPAGGARYLPLLQRRH